MIDLTFLKQFTKDDPVKMKRYISLYLDVAQKTFEEMHRNFSNGDWEQLRINAHSLKPQADFMGISSLKDELINIEEAVKWNNYDDLESLLQSCLSLSKKADQELKKIVEQM